MTTEALATLQELTNADLHMPTAADQVTDWQQVVTAGLLAAGHTVSVDVHEFAAPSGSFTVHEDHIEITDVCYISLSETTIELGEVIYSFHGQRLPDRDDPALGTLEVWQVDDGSAPTAQLASSTPG